MLIFLDERKERRMKVFLVYLVFINILTFAVYGTDKAKAKKHAWRIPEKTLLFLAVLGGSVGAWLGMRIFRHKTKHVKFVVGVPVIFFLQAIAAMAIYFYRCS